MSGHGRYVDDVVVPGMLHVAFVRSPVARGTITRLEVEEARRLPGVVAVFTAADLNAGSEAMWPSVIGPPNDQIVNAPYYALAAGDVRFVGDPVALVVAESRYLAEDGCDLVELDIDPLPPVLDLDAAGAPDAPLVHPELASNIWGQTPDAPDPEFDAIFASAPHVVTRTFSQQRQTNVPMETRGIVAHYEPATGELALWAASQGIHEWRVVASRLLNIPESRVRAIMGDVGGAFGQKVTVMREDVSVILATRKLGRPLKWIEDRRENLISANSARHERATVTMAVDDAGTILGVRLHYVEDLGTFAVMPASCSSFVPMLFPGPYKISQFRYSGVSVFTNTVGKAAYRGPWLMETVAREQMMDHVAREIGLDPAEFRRRNVVTQADLPYTLPSGVVYDVATPAETLEQATQMVDYAGFRAEQERARAQGRYLGLGLSLYIEPSAISFGIWATDPALLRVDPTGQVTVAMGTGSHGHSLETTIPQVVAEHLGCAIEDVVFVQGDTAAAPYGGATGGSRSAVIAGGAAQTAAVEMRAKVLEIAAHAFEAAPEDLELEAGVISVRGTPTKQLTLAEVALLAYSGPAGLPEGAEAGLEVLARFAPPSPFTWSNACHVCTCEVDVATGMVQLLRYVVSEDCGVMINPMVVEGQIAGGVVQGIGGVLFEELPYDEDGNPLATTFLDYLLPTAAEVPMIEYGHIETPSNSLGGYKGMGEGGAIGAPPAVANAIADALAPFGVVVTDFPLGPAQVRALLPS